MWDRLLANIFYDGAGADAEPSNHRVWVDRVPIGPPTWLVVRLSKTPVIVSVIKMQPHKTAVQKVIILKSDEWSHASRFDNFMITQIFCRGL